MCQNIKEERKDTYISYYDKGYEQGYRDATIDIRMKLLQHTKLLRSPKMQEWEEGYIDGYMAGQKERKRVSGK